jgi:hypothetical protein
MLSRCCERNGTLAVWDLSGSATPKKALAVIEDLPCKYLQTQINWSPDETLILTGALLVPSRPVLVPAPPCPALP